MKKKLVKLLVGLIGVASLFGCSSTNSSNSVEVEDVLSIGLLKADFKTVKRASGEEKPYNIQGHNLALESSVNIIYYVEQNDVNAEKGLLIWDQPVSNYNEQSAKYKLSKESSPYIYQGKTYDVYIFDKLAAKQMSDYFYARPYEIIQGEYKLYSLDRYSIIDYAKSFEGSTEKLDSHSSVTLGEAIEALLNYGGTIQKLFCYKTDRCVLNPFYEVTLKQCFFDDGFSTKLCFSGETIKIIAYERLNEVVFDFYQKETGTLTGIENHQGVNYVLNNLQSDVTFGCRIANYTHFSVENSTLKSYNGNDEDVHVFATLYQNSFTKIATGCFKNNENIRCIRIPSSVNEVEDGAFQNLPNLEVVYFEKNSDDYDFYIENLFVNCSAQVCFNCPFTGADFVMDRFGLVRYVGLDRKVAIPSYYDHILNGAFAYLPIYSVTLNDSIRTIPNNCFANCKYLRSVKFKNVYSIGDNAFEYCPHLSDINISEKITYYGESPFFQAEGLIVTASDDPGKQNSGIFSGFKGKVVYNWTKTDTTWIYDHTYLYRYNGDDEVVTITNADNHNFSFVYSGAFDMLSNLKKIIFDKVTLVLQENSIKDNPNLEKVYLYNNLIFSQRTFVNNPKLLNIYLPIGIRSLVSDFYVNENPVGETTLYCNFPEYIVNQKQHDENWIPEDFDNVVFDSGNPDDFIVENNKIVGYKGLDYVTCIPGKVKDTVITEISSNASFDVYTPTFLLFLSPNVSLKANCLSSITSEYTKVFISKDVVTVEGNLNSNLKIYSDVETKPDSWGDIDNFTAGCEITSFDAKTYIF